jgi:hypothetical protein
MKKIVESFKSMTPSDHKATTADLSRAAEFFDLFFSHPSKTYFLNHKFFNYQQNYQNINIPS